MNDIPENAFRLWVLQASLEEVFAFFLERNGLYLVSPQPHAKGEAEGLQAEGLNLLV